MVGTKPDPKASQVNTKPKLEILYIFVYDYGINSIFCCYYFFAFLTF